MQTSRISGTEPVAPTHLFFAAFQQGDDRHGVPVPQLKIIFEPANNFTGFDVGSKCPPEFDS